uniref:Serine-rich adhesin for platelets-like n=1 Tax=Phallusia mammillata TaxID=59560 RepID=A0A6F9D6Y4_9ASCI|nr:serine-rich adhesin for platelets-like [Phallusia mammillata]
MDVSSKQVIDAVAEKIKYYMDIKRREDGFDLSGPSQPKMKYPRVKTGSVLNSGKLHDRSLKHYFTPNMIRTQIANMEAMPPGTERQKTVKRKLKRSLTSPRRKNESSFMDDELFTAQMEALSLLENSSRNRMHSRVYPRAPSLRKAAPSKISRNEVNRLINRSSQILVATETVALAHDIIASRHRTRPQSAPAVYHGHSQSFPGLGSLPQRPGTARGRYGVRSASARSNKRRPKYAWDINGRKVPYRSLDHDSLDEAGSSSYSVSSSSVEYNDHLMHSTPKRHFNKPHRPYSARNHHGNYSHNDTANRPYSAGLLRHRDYVTSPGRPTISPDSGFSVNAGTQTPRRPNDRRRGRHVIVIPSDRSSDDGGHQSPTELRKYRVEIHTGDRLGAGTAADVYLTLHGSRSDTDEMYLTNTVTADAHHKQKAFRRGQVDTFDIETEDVGKLRKIGIGHDQKEKAFSWFLDRVVVSCKDRTWKFECNTWLSGDLGDKLTFRYFKTAKKSHKDSSESDTSSSSDDDRPMTARYSNAQKKVEELTGRHSSSSSSSSSRSSRRSNAKQQPQQQHGFHHSSSSSDQGSVSAHTKPASDRRSEVDLKSHLEYSSDSSAARGKSTVRDTESYVEESEDSNTSSSDSDTVAASSGDEASSVGKEVEKKLGKGDFSSSASSDSETEDEMRLKRIVKEDASDERRSSSSESEDTEQEADKLFEVSEFKVEKTNDFDTRSDKALSSSNKSSSSESEKEDESKNDASNDSASKTAAAPPKIESSSASSSDEDAKEDSKSPFSFITDRFRSSSHSSHSSHSSSSSSSDSDIIEEEPPKRVARLPSFAEVVPLQRHESADVIAAPDVTFDTVTMETIQEPVSAEVEVTEHHMLTATSPDDARSVTSDRSSRKPSSSSESSSSESEEEIVEQFEVPPQTESTDIPSSLFAQQIRADVHSEETHHDNEQDTTVTEARTDDDVRSSASDKSSRHQSSSSSSESSSSDEDATVEEDFSKTEEATTSSAVHMATTTTATDEDALREEAKEIADVYMDGFNAGIEVTRKLNVTNPALFTEESSWQPATSETSGLMEENEEDGVIQTPSHLVIRRDVHDLIKEGDARNVIELLTVRPELKEQQNEKGWRPIHIAASNGKLEILQWLAANGVNLGAETPTGYTAIHMAAIHGHVQCMMVIHAMGGSLNAVNVDGQTALHLSCMSGHLSAVKWLVANSANVRLRDNSQRTALALAKQYRHKEIALFLKTLLRDLRKQDSSVSLIMSSKSSIASSNYSTHSSHSSSSSSSSSSSDEEGKTSDAERDTSWDNGTTPHSESYEERQRHELDERKRIYEQQQERIRTRRTSFLDAIRAETEENLLETTTSEA